MVIGLLALVLFGGATAGDRILAADVDLGAVYDSRVVQARGAPYLHLSPGVVVEHTTDDLLLSLRGEYLLRKHLASPWTAADRFGDFRIDADVEVGRDRAAGFTVRERAWRLQGDDAEEVYPRHLGADFFRNDFGGAAAWRPHPSLQLTLGGSWMLDVLPLPSGPMIASIRAFNRRHALGPVAAARWAVAESHTLILEGSATWNRWAENWIQSSDVYTAPITHLGSYLGMPDSTHAEVVAGWEGRLGERLVLTARGGYGLATYHEQSVLDEASGEEGFDPSELDEDAGFHADASGWEHLLAAAELRYEVEPGASLSLGYTRGLEDSWMTNYAACDQIVAEVDLTVASRLGLHAEGGVGREQYQGEFLSDTVVLRIGAEVSWSVTGWADLSVTARWDERAMSAVVYDVEDLRIAALATLTY